MKRSSYPSVEGEGVTATIQDGVIDFSAAASVGGPLVRQVELLPPGDYRLSGRGEGIDQPDEARPYWTLTCGDRELGRVAVTNSGRDRGDFAGSIAVPAGCPLQTLTLIAPPSDAAAGSSGRIDRLSLAPAG